MKISKKWAIAVVAGVLVPASIWAATQSFFPSFNSPSTLINCAAGNSCAINVAASVSPSIGQDAASQGQTFGATPADQVTTWTGGHFTGDLTVDGTSTLTGAVTLGGSLTSSSGANFVPFFLVSMTNGTTTPCAIQNTSGNTRTVLAASYKYSSTTAVGVVNVTAGTSTDAFTTSTTPFVAAALTTVAGRDIITTTSTFNTLSGTTSSTIAYSPWRANEWMVWKSTSTTNAGNCYVEYY